MVASNMEAGMTEGYERLDKVADRHLTPHRTPTP